MKGYLNLLEIYFQGSHFTIYELYSPHSHWRKQCPNIRRKRVDLGLTFKVSTVDIRIK